MGRKPTPLENSILGPSKKKYAIPPTSPMKPRAFSGEVIGEI